MAWNFSKFTLAGIVESEQISYQTSKRLWTIFQASKIQICSRKKERETFWANRGTRKRKRYAYKLNWKSRLDYNKKIIL